MTIGMDIRRAGLAIICCALGVEAQMNSSTLVQRCPGLRNRSDVACVHRYASVLPAPFERAFAVNGTDPVNDTFVQTSVPGDSSFKTLQNATFVVFEQTRGLEILGSSPKIEKMFPPRNAIHEAPVYVPGLNVIIFSVLESGVYEQQLINLNNTPPTMEPYTTSPPIYGVNGGKWHHDRIYWAAGASFPFPSPTTNETIHQAPGIYSLDPYTNKTTCLVNNYFGTQLNSPDDLTIDSNGDIFFTDPWYGYALNFTTRPRLPAQTYRFRPSTGSLSLVENSIRSPNGIGLSPDGRTLYISDTGPNAFPTILPKGPSIPYSELLPYGGDGLYAFDVSFSPVGNYLTNKRVIAYAVPDVADGFHVSREGDLLGAGGTGVNVLSAFGEMVMRIEMGGTVNQVQFAGEGREELWTFGPPGIFRVRGLQGIHGMVDE